MSKLKTLIFSYFLFTGVAALPAEMRTLPYANDYGFEQSRMIIDRGEIFIISSFDGQDHVTAYNFFGTRLWNAPFHAKILSWEVTDGLLVVFSKDRDGHSTYLTCINRKTG